MFSKIFKSNLFIQFLSGIVLLLLLGCTSDESYDNSNFVSEVNTALPDNSTLSEIPFVIIGKSDQQPYNMILTSSDGLIWESIDLLNSNIDVNTRLDFQDFIFTNQFVAITTDSILNSTDGKIWNKFNMSSLNIDYISLRGIIYGNNTYVMISEGVQNNYPKIFYSENLTDWTNLDVSSFLPNEKHPDSIVFCNNYFWILGSNSEIYKSENGSIWESLGSTTVTDPKTLLCFENKIILTPSTNQHVSKSSDDGTNWESFPNTSYPYLNVQGIAYKSPYYVMKETNTLKIAQNLTGTWINVVGLNSIDSGSETINKIILKNNIFIITTDKGQIFSSEDGYSWTKNLSIITNQYMNFLSVQ